MHVLLYFVMKLFFFIMYNTKMQHFENVIFYILYNIFFLSFSIFEYLMYYLKLLKLQQKRMRDKWSRRNRYKDAFEISAGCIYILFLLFSLFILFLFFLWSLSSFQFFYIFHLFFLFQTNHHILIEVISQVTLDLTN